MRIARGGIDSVLQFTHPGISVGVCLGKRGVQRFDVDPVVWRRAGCDIDDLPGRRDRAD